MYPGPGRSWCHCWLSVKRAGHQAIRRRTGTSLIDSSKIAGGGVRETEGGMTIGSLQDSLGMRGGDPLNRARSSENGERKWIWASFPVEP